MNYEEIVRDTDQVIRDAMTRSNVYGAIMVGIVLVITALFVLLAIEELRTKRAVRRTVVKNAQYWSWAAERDNDGERTWTRMGPAIKVVEDADRRQGI